MHLQQGFCCIMWGKLVGRRTSCGKGRFVPLPWNKPHLLQWGNWGLHECNSWCWFVLPCADRLGLGKGLGCGACWHCWSWPLLGMIQPHLTWSLPFPDLFYPSLPFFFCCLVWNLQCPACAAAAANMHGPAWGSHWHQQQQLQHFCDG